MHEGHNLLNLYQAAQLLAKGGQAAGVEAMRLVGASTAYGLEMQMNHLSRMLAQVGSGQYAWLRPWVQGMSPTVAASGQVVAQQFATAAAEVGTVAAAEGAGAAGAGAAGAGAGAAAGGAGVLGAIAAVAVAAAVIGGVYMAANWGEPDARPVPSIVGEPERPEQPEPGIATDDGFVVVQVANHGRRALAVLTARDHAAHERGDATLMVCNFLHGGRCADQVVVTPNGTEVRGQDIPARLSVLGRFEHATPEVAREQAWRHLCAQVDDVRAERLAEGFSGRQGDARVTIDWRNTIFAAAPCSFPEPNG